MAEYVVRLKFHLKNDSPFWSGDESEGRLEDNQLRVFGSSLFGSIKNNLVNEERKSLFGVDEGKEYIESKIMISDMVGNNLKKIKKRPGIRVNQDLGSALDGGLYEDYCIEPESIFEFRLEAKLTSKEKKLFDETVDEIIESIGNGRILFGKNRTKGYGKFKIEKLERKDFNLRKKEELRDYLDWNDKSEYEEVPIKEDWLDSNTIIFKGKLKGSFLIKGEIEGKIQKSYKENERFIIPSGTLKGSIRSYSEKILNILGKEKKEKDEILSELFGHSPDESKEFKMGKLIIEDSEIKENGEKKYSRIKIDRFTGGVINGALFQEERIVKGEITLKIRIRKELEDREKALLLLYLRDLGQEKISLGSGASVGNGRVVGEKIKFEDLEIDLKNLSSLGNKEKKKVNGWIEAL